MQLYTIATIKVEENESERELLLYRFDIFLNCCRNRRIISPLRICCANNDND